PSILGDTSPGKRGSWAPTKRAIASRGVFGPRELAGPGCRTQLACMRRETKTDTDHHGAARPTHRMRGRRWRRVLPISLAVAATLLMGSADAWAKANLEAPAPAAPAPTSEPAAAVVALAEAAGLSFEGAYAEREQAAQALEAF